MKPNPRSVLLAAIVVTTLAACDIRTGGGEQVPEPSAPNLELRVYDLPAGAGKQVRNVLGQVFSQGKDTPPLAKVEVAPDGRLLVVGPASIHAGVEVLLKDLGKVTQAAPATIDMKYWLVLGKSGAGPVPPDLAEIAPALEAVSKAEGGMSFQSYESVRIRTSGDEWGSAEGRRVEIRQETSANVSGGIIHARVNIDPAGPGRIDTRLELRTGELVVLGETGIDLFEKDVPGLKLTGPMETRKLFYVVRPTIIDATKTP